MITYAGALYALGTGAPLYDDYDFAYRIERLRKDDTTWTIQVRCIDRDELTREWTRELDASLAWLSV